MEQMIIAMVRDGQPIDKIKRHMLTGIINGALLKHYGNQTKAAAELNMNRCTVRAYWHNRVQPIHTDMTFTQAREFVQAVAVAEALRIEGGNVTAAARLLVCSRWAIWRFRQ